MTYTLVPTKVYVCFYDRSDDWRGKLIKYICLTDIHHCGIMLARKDKNIVLFSGKTHKAAFVDGIKFHRSCYKPSRVIELGEACVSIQQLTDFLYSKEYPNSYYIGNERSILLKYIVFWFFLGRFILPKLLPPSCALLTCYLLRICGFKVGNHVEPKTLYKELTDAVNCNSWTSWSWEDYLSKNDC